MITTIRVYNDIGTSTLCVYNTIHLFHHFFPCANVFVISSSEIKTSQWVENTDLLVIPGGEDLPYLDKLQMDGIELIKSFVLNGGKFLGICAGAYFSSSYIKFNANSQLPIEGERYLKFYEGNAIGPVYDGYQPNSESGAHIVKIKYNNSYA